MIVYMFEIVSQNKVNVYTMKVWLTHMVYPYLFQYFYKLFFLSVMFYSNLVKQTLNALFKENIFTLFVSIFFNENINFMQELNIIILCFPMWSISFMILSLLSSSFKPNFLLLLPNLIHYISFFNYIFLHSQREIDAQLLYQARNSHPLQVFLKSFNTSIN